MAYEIPWERKIEEQPIEQNENNQIINVNNNKNDIIEDNADEEYVGEEILDGSGVPLSDAEINNSDSYCTPTATDEEQLEDTNNT